VLSDTIQPFLTFSGIYEAALKDLRMEIADLLRLVKSLDAQNSGAVGVRRTAGGDW
jgi:hypothetical protein